MFLINFSESISFILMKFFPSVIHKLLILPDFLNDISDFITLCLFFVIFSEM